MNGKFAVNRFSSYIDEFARRAKNSPFVSRLAMGAFWSITGAIILKSSRFFSSIIIARLLGKAGFGEFGIIQSTIGMFGTVAGFGLGLMATRYVAEFRVSDPPKAGRIIALSHILAYTSGGLVALVLVIASPWLAKHTLAAPHLSPLLQLSAGFLLLSSVNGMQQGILAGFEAFKQIARINLLSGLISFPLLVSGVYLGGLRGVVLGMITSSFVDVLLSHMAIKTIVIYENIPLRLSHCFHEWVVIWKFSLPAMLSGITVSPVTWACSALLVNQPNGYAEMGIFNAALVVYRLIYAVGTVAGAPLLPILASERNSPNGERSKRVNILLNWAIGVFIALILLSFPEIFELLYGRKFIGDTFRRVFVLILYLTCINMAKQGLSRVLAADNLMWWGFCSNTLWGVMMLSGSYFLVRWGAVGQATSYAIAYTISTAVFLPFYIKMGLVPKNTLISLEAGLIWLIIGLLIAMIWLNYSVVVRSLIFLLALFAVSYGFYRLLGFAQPERV